MSVLNKDVPQFDPGLRDFEAALYARFRLWSDVKAEVGAQPGLRICLVFGEVLREFLIKRREAEMFAQIFAQLPIDACLVNYFQARTMPYLNMVNLPDGGGDVGYSDGVCFPVASREWPTLERDAVIPYLKLNLIP